ncbi:MAG: hypothetical protein R3E89_06315 [Thiolinea sp.]
MPKIRRACRHEIRHAGRRAAFALQTDTPPVELTSYSDSFKANWIQTELHAARNVRPSFKWGFCGWVPCIPVWIRSCSGAKRRGH